MPDHFPPIENLIGEKLRQTFQFKKWNLSLISYDATALEGVKLPIHTHNVNDRLAQFFAKV